MCVVCGMYSRTVIYVWLLCMVCVLCALVVFRHVCMHACICVMRVLYVMFGMCVTYVCMHVYVCGAMTYYVKLWCAMWFYLINGMCVSTCVMYALCALRAMYVIYVVHVMYARIRACVCVCKYVCTSRYGALYCVAVSCLCCVALCDVMLC